MRSSVLFFLVAANPVDGAERERIAAKAGHEAVEAALAGELAKAEKAGDKEHIASIEAHEKSYLGEVAESKNHNRERAAAAAGPAAVKAALAGELAEAEKFHDTEHEQSINDHLQDYLNDVHESRTHERQREAASDGPAAVKAALEGELKEAEKFGDV